jgi:hypothetical protein
LKTVTKNHPRAMKQHKIYMSHVDLVLWSSQQSTGTVGSSH